jgi:hypothetical protein
MDEFLLVFFVAVGNVMWRDEDAQIHRYAFLRSYRSPRGVNSLSRG